MLYIPPPLDVAEFSEKVTFVRLELLLEVRAVDLDEGQEADLTAAFFCDVLTLVRGDPPRPLPLWF